MLDGKEEDKEATACSSATKETSRIEELPDDVLVHILSFFTTLAEKVRSSVLSRRWRNVWRYITFLDFDATMLHMDQVEINDAWYIAWVNKVLDDRVALPGLPLVKELRIQYAMDTSHSWHIDRWISFAIANRVETLHLDFYPYCDKIHLYENYMLHEECWHRVPLGLSNLNGLKSLYLSCVKVNQQFVEFILSSCPLLEDLSLVLVGLQNNLDVSGGPPLRLRRLKIDTAGDFTFTKLCAPYLTSLYYESDECNPQKVDVPLLTNLTIGSTSGKLLIMKYLEPFWSYLPQLEKLELIIEKAETFRLRQTPKLVKLKYLKISVFHYDEDMDCRVITFIDACPMLETFALEIFELNSFTFFVDMDQHKKKLHKLERRCSFKCLKEVELYGVDGQTIDQAATRFIIRNAPNLEKLTIDTRTPTRYHISSFSRPKAVKIAEVKAKRLCQGSHLDIEITVTG
ncbi:unnamed protein product [Rhodiola kirilowii]